MKRQLLEEGARDSRLSVNPQYAEKFEQRKRREQLDRAKKVYGRELQDAEEDSCSEDEDEDAELVDDRLQAKFMTYIAKLKTGPEQFYSLKESYFKEDDFAKTGRKERKSKIGLGEVLLRDYNQVNMDSEEEPQPDLNQKQRRRLKQEFKAAAQKDQPNQDFFKVKEKTKKQVEDEKKLLEAYGKEVEPDQSDVLRKFWADDSKLDPVDKYLRRFLLTKGWIDRSGNRAEYDEADLEDSQRSQEMDQFQQKYNFRFEQPGGTQIVSHPRKVEQTARIKEKSKRAKESVVEKRSEARGVVKQARRVQQLKKEEILSRIERIKDVGKLQSHPQHLVAMVDGDWDEDKHDRLMAAQFGQEYYCQEEDMEEQEGQGEAEVENRQEDKDNVLNAKPGIPLSQKKAVKAEEVALLKENDLTLWWYCDKCNKGIGEEQPRFDCTQCPDFTLCGLCTQKVNHGHRLKRFIVPRGCAPPDDNQIKQILSKYKKCKHCLDKFAQDQNYYSKLKQTLCLQCWDKLSPQQQKQWAYHQGQTDFAKMLQTNPQLLKEKFIDDKLNQLVDEYCALNYEDVLPSGLKTKFKYVEVKPQSFGLSDEQLLFAQDKVLNQYVSIKKLAPYREQKVRERNSFYKAKISSIKQSAKQAIKQTRERSRNKEDKKKKVEQKQKEEVVIEQQVPAGISKSRLKSYGY